MAALPKRDRRRRPGTLSPRFRLAFCRLYIPLFGIYISFNDIQIWRA
ncbi:hypothetical protein L524_3865 [Bordetella bronchiseptica MBORD762]|nr:hypothetical protein L524_3865 [Bordetella bronchiseptica MBORD762]